uniref:Uncharacterized protein n=1 Tax=Rhizophora mucronata TaxID=61149 RepID=A0A2P2IRN3_RHIMU
MNLARTKQNTPQDWISLVWASTHDFKCLVKLPSTTIQIYHASIVLRSWLNIELRTHLTKIFGTLGN